MMPSSGGEIPPLPLRTSLAVQGLARQELERRGNSGSKGLAPAEVRDGIQNERNSEADEDQAPDPGIVWLQSTLFSRSSWVELFAEKAPKDQPDPHENLKPPQCRPPPSAGFHPSGCVTFSLSRPSSDLQIAIPATDQQVSLERGDSEHLQPPKARRRTTSHLRSLTGGRSLLERSSGRRLRRRRPRYRTGRPLSAWS